MRELALGDREPTLRVKTRPNDANQSGDIFGGWLMSQIDVAGAMEAHIRARGPVVTVAVKELLFIQPIYVYDLVSFYTKIEKVGKTSVTVSIETFATRFVDDNYQHIKVSTATLVYVAVSEPGKKRLIPSE